MAVCYFDYKYDKKYNCEYEIKKDGIEIIVNYDIYREIPAINGVKEIGRYTEFKERDILIVDNKTRMNYLLKKAYFYGNSIVSGTPDAGYKTKFFSEFYFKDKDYKKLCVLQKNNNTKKLEFIAIL